MWKNRSESFPSRIHALRGATLLVWLAGCSSTATDGGTPPDDASAAAYDDIARPGLSDAPHDATPIGVADGAPALDGSVVEAGSTPGDAAQPGMPDASDDAGASP